MSKKADMHLDVLGMCCPVPLLRLATAVKGLAPGQIVEIVGNDPLFETSIGHFCQANNHQLLEIVSGDRHVVRMQIKVGGP